MRIQPLSSPATLMLGIEARVRRMKMFWRTHRLASGWRVAILNLEDRLRQCVVPEPATASATGFVLVRLFLWTALALSAVHAIQSALDATAGAAFLLRVHYPSALSWLSEPLLDRGAGIAILAAIAGISGVLLGLYFSAYSSATTQLFDRLPGPVQQAIAEKGEGLRYAESLAVLTSATLALSVWVAFNHALPLAAYAATVTWAAVVIAMGLVSTWRTFGIFDSAQVAGMVATHVLNAVRSCNLGVPRASNPSWQQHQRKRASRHLRSLRALVSAVLQQESAVADDQRRLAEVLSAAVSGYLKMAGAVPPDSEWHAIREKRVWPYAADAFYRHVGLSLGHATGTAQERDRSWVERELLDQMLLIPVTLATRGRLEAAADALRSFANAVQDVGEFGRWQVLQDALDRASSEIKVILSPAAARPPHRGELMLSDALVSLELAPLLGLMRRAEKLEGRSWASATGVTWGRPSRRHFARLGPGYADALWDVHQWAAREQRIEGRILTGQDYIMQRLVGWDVWDVVEASSVWIQGARRRITAYRQAVHSAEDGRLEVLASWHVRGCVTRVGGLLDKLEKHWAAVEQNQELDSPGLKARVGRIRESVRAWHEESVQAEAQALGTLVAASQLAGEPHWFAETVQHLAGDCVTALETGQDELLAQIFPLYFAGAQAAVWFAGAPASVADTSQLMLKWRPFVEVLEISGLGYLHAAIQDRPVLWEIIRAVWNSWLEADSHSKLDQLVLVYQLYATPDGILGEGQVLSNWRRSVLGAASLLPRRAVTRRGSFGVGYEYDHDNREVAALGRDSVMHDLVGRDVFARAYLKKRCDSGGRRYAHL